MARPREFDEKAVLDAAVSQFWSCGYEATSVRDLVDATGLTAASLYNAFGDKRALYQRALDHYVDRNVSDRIQRCTHMPAREAIEAFFNEILRRSLEDPECKGCMLVNSALELAPHDPAFRVAVSEVLRQIEAFLLERVKTGQEEGTITRSHPAEELARHLLGVLMGVRVLARVRPERDLLEGVVGPALKLLDP